MGRRRPRLLVRFGVISAVAVLVLGLVLADRVRDHMADEALQDARTLATTTGRLALQPTLAPEDLRRPLDRERSRRLTRLVEDGLADTGIHRVKLWNRAGVVVYSDDPEVQGKRFPVGHHLEEALAGEVASEVEGTDEAEDGGAKMVEVYVPLRFAADGAVAGAFEVYVPWARVADRIERRQRDLLIILGVGLLLLWGALFRLVMGASRSLVRFAEENRRLAREDALTGLANRESFLEQTDAALGRTPPLAAVVLLDLDRFKDLNDSLGHHAGDLLLREIGPRLRAALPEGSVIARLGGDEFAALLDPLSTPAEAQLLAQGVRRTLAEPVEISGIAVAAEASVGIALFPDDGRDARALLQHADVAMYAAKQQRTGVSAYRRDADRSSHERLLVLSELREAIERDELVLHYQPKVDLADGRVVGAEALVRWQHPRRGLLGPQHFVGLAEHTGLIGPLTAWVLTRAARDARRWRDAGVEIGVAVNLSVANLVDPELPDLVARLLAETRMPPRALELEITESVLMTEPGRALDTLRLLRSMGVGLAVDDYGTGHSSLAYLQRLPLDTLKIDRSFVASMMGEGGGVIVRSTVDLAHNLGLRVVAEGIEDQPTATALRALGCDLGQGFHYARPVPVDELLDRLAAPSFTATVAGRPAGARPGTPARAGYPAPSA